MQNIVVASKIKLITTILSQPRKREADQVAIDMESSATETDTRDAILIEKSLT